MYLSGVEADKVRKLLGIPECCSGKGVDEFELVRDFLMKWKVKNQIIGMVFIRLPATAVSTLGPVSTLRSGSASPYSG